MIFMHMQSMLLRVICLLHVYVCYMFLYLICLEMFVSVMCLVLVASCICICLFYVVMLYVSYMLYVCHMSSLGGVVRIRFYIIYAHLCNHILL